MSAAALRHFLQLNLPPIFLPKTQLECQLMLYGIFVAELAADLFAGNTAAMSAAAVKHSCS
jgi:hypothetical protein